MSYHDDCEPNRDIGPYCEKLGCGYVSLPCLPPEYQSKLQNIFLALLINGDDRSSYGNDRVFRPLIEELTLLAEKGVQVERIDGSVATIHFVTALLMGDNLGLNSTSGFVASCSALHFCRMCKSPKINCQSLVREDSSSLRNPTNYEQDVLLNDPKLTGVKEKCIFDKVTFFQAPTDVGVDPFHDLLEGVCHFTMIPVIRHFQSEDASFLERLNDRMYFFDYGVDSDNKPPSILSSALEKEKLKITGCEMLTFVRLFGVIVGDLVDEGSEYWRLYTLLHDIVMICLSKRVPVYMTSVLQVLVKDHHELNMKLTGKKLKPKHHFLTHYSRLFSLFGPLGSLSTVRNEAKHKVVKAVANVCCSRRNVPLTIAVKEQLALCYRFECGDSVRPPFMRGPGQLVNLQKHEQFTAFESTLPGPILDNASQFCPRWMDYLSTKYKVGMFLVTGTDDFRCPEFSRIEVMLTFENEPLFICSSYYSLGIDCHVKAYAIQKVEGKLSWFCIKHCDLLDPMPLSGYLTANGNTVIVSKHLLVI